LLAITELGQKILNGDVDFRSLQPAPRWVGGVEVCAGNPDWRWNEQQKSSIRRS
jgi:hypothetical protein